MDAQFIQDASLWIQRADQALYMSKRSGKDSVTLAPAQLEVQA
jgi:PleD family two-component response regulator